MQSPDGLPYNVTDHYNGRYSYIWNPLKDWRADEEHLGKMAEEECQKIISYSNADFFKHVEVVISSRLGWITCWNRLSIEWYDFHGIATEVLINTVQSILDCIESRLEGK